METPIADILAICMTPRESLGVWCDQGLASRHWEMLRPLLSHYGRLLLITPDGRTKADLQAALPAEPDVDRVEVISNTGGLPAERWNEVLPGRVAEAVGSAGSVVIETTEMCCGVPPVRITQALHARGVTAALVSKGGHPWTRFVAFEYGTSSTNAQEAGAIEGELCRAADLVVGSTKSMIEDLAWRYQLDLDRCRVIPKFVLTHMPPTPTEHREEGLLVYAGRLLRRKRVGILLEAMAMLPEEVREKVRLEIIGDGPAREELEAQAQRLGVDATFRGILTNAEVHRRMRACSLFLQPSALEGQSACLLEAMSTGAPVLVAKSPGLEGTVLHGQNGLVLDPLPDAFALGIQEGLADRDWRDVLGAAGARVVRENFGLHVVMKQVVDGHRFAMEHARRRTRLRVAG